MYEELNKKLAEWAGFTCYWEEGATDGLWHYPDEAGIQMRKDIPNFTESLDACFKWLVPKVYEKQRDFTSHGDITIGYWKTSDNTFRCKLTVWDRGEREYWGYTEEENNPALALCLSIEKLIEGKA